MDNSVNRVNISQNGFNGDSKKVPSEISEAKKYYDDFVETMNKSDFCNTDRRYVAELVYARKLKELYFQYNCEDLFKEMSEKEAVILEKLKNDFGITYK